MELGYYRPLFILPFDQRSSFAKSIFGFKPPLTQEQTATVIASKQVVYDGFKLALSKGAPRDTAAILVDEEFGAAILRDARAAGVVTCAPTEKSGQEEFFFEYGDRWRDHIEAFAPTFAKVLVRYNPENDEAMNRRQAARLKEVSDYCRKTERHFLFELLVQELCRTDIDALALPDIFLDEHRRNQGTNLLRQLRTIENNADREPRKILRACLRHGRDRRNRNRLPQMIDDQFLGQTVGIACIQIQIANDRFQPRRAQDLLLHRCQALVDVVRGNGCDGLDFGLLNED